MKKDDYINSVLSSFVGRNKEMIKDELESHLEDRIERFVEMGYTSSQAEQMAVEKMGNAEILGAKMTKIHSKRTAVDTFCVLLIANIGWLILLFLTFLAWGSEVSLLTLGAEYMFLFLSTISLIAANKLKYEPIALMSFMCTAIFAAGEIILGFHSLLLYGAYFIFSGNMNDFLIIAQLKNNVIGNLLFAFTVIFYFVWVLSYVFTIINISKFNKQKYSKKDVIRENYFKKSIVLVLLFFTVIVAVLFGFKLNDGNGNQLVGTSDFYYDGVCIIESNEICDIEECYYNYDSSPQYLCRGYDWGTMTSSVDGYNLFSDNCRESTRAYNDAVVYSFYSLSSRYVNSEKYVAAIPVHFDDYREIPCFDNVQWYDTNEVKEITGSLNRDTDPVQTGNYSIEISNVSAMNDEEAIKYATGVLDEMISGYYFLDERDVKMIEGVTNSVYIGTGIESIYDYHSFVMNDKIDIHIVLESQTVSYYIDGKMVYELNYGDDE